MNFCGMAWLQFVVLLILESYLIVKFLVFDCKINTKTQSTCETISIRMKKSISNKSCGTIYTVKPSKILSTLKSSSKFV